MTMPRTLLIERPHEKPQTVPFDAGAINRFHLDPQDVFLLETGETVFVGDTAFSLEEVDTST